MDKKKYLTRLIHEELPGARILLFGSRARGDHTQTSDYDLAVISEQAIDKKTLFSTLNKKIIEELNIPIDLVLYTPEEYEQGKYGFLPELIEKEGIELKAP